MKIGERGLEAGRAEGADRLEDSLRLRQQVAPPPPLATGHDLATAATQIPGAMPHGFALHSPMALMT